MTVSSSAVPIGRIASLHLHPARGGEPLQAVDSIELVEGRGIRGEPRYFGRNSRSTGKPSRRQVSLIEREQIARHAAALGLETIAPGAVRSNIETLGVRLAEFLGREIQIGDAVLFLYEARTPCPKMDALCDGLKELMGNHRQGVLAEVRCPGVVRVNDPIFACRPTIGTP
jgi:MOSC domain-containing protein YiiM